MSQERTERIELDPVIAGMPVTTTAGEMHRMLTEIDRLNAVIADREKHIEWMTACAGSYEKRIDRLTAKVQDRDTEIIRQRERGDRLDSELHKQNCRNQDQAEEIERMNAVIKAQAQGCGINIVIKDDTISRLNKHLEDMYVEKRELAAEVQEQDKQVERLTSENESLRQTIARYFGDAKTVQEYEQAEDALRAEVDELKERLAIRTNTAKKSLEAAHAEVNRRAAREEEASKEIERLRAAMECTASMLEQFHMVEYYQLLPGLAEEQAKRLRAAQKGAE